MNPYSTWLPVLLILTFNPNFFNNFKKFTKTPVAQLYVFGIRTVVPQLCTRRHLFPDRCSHDKMFRDRSFMTQK